MEIIEIDQKLLFQPQDYGFNPTFCRYKNQLYFAYRREYRPGNEYAQIYIGRLNDKFQPIKDSIQLVEIPRPAPDTGLFEDPRLFVFQDSLYLSFIAATIHQGGHFAAQGLVRLNDQLQPERIWYPNIGSNDNYALGGNKAKGEKNWTFFPYCNHLYIIYSIEPLIVYDFNTDEGSCELISEISIQPKWRWGNLSGSTPLIRFKDKWVGCFHSFLFDRKELRNYFVGFYVLDPINWRITQISCKPVLEAKRDDALELRDKSYWWKPNAIFPCGLICDEEYLYLSYGWQDCRSFVAKLAWSELQLHSITQYYERVRVLRDPQAGVPGGFKFGKGQLQLKSSSWPHIAKQARRANIPLLEVDRQIAAELPDEYTKYIWNPL